MKLSREQAEFLRRVACCRYFRPEHKFCRLASSLEKCSLLTKPCPGGSEQKKVYWVSHGGHKWLADNPPEEEKKVTDVKFESWAIVEVMGHSRYVGFVSEQAIGGCSFVRVDVPDAPGCPAFTKLLSQGSIFAITPVAEDVARGMATKARTQPVSVWDLPSQPQIAAVPRPNFEHIDREPDINHDEEDF